LARAHRSYRELLLQLADSHATAANLQILEALRASNERRS
jgi:hypothetical protein